MTEARIDALVWMSCAENPGVFGSTRNPRTWPSSAFAQTSATSAIDPLVIHIFVPSSTHPFPERRARVCIAPGSLPAFGSVSPKHPIRSPAAIAGSHVRRCSSLPNAWMGYMTSAPWTEANDRTPLSPRSSSCMMSPYAMLLMPAHPYSWGRLAPNSRSAPSFGTSSLGNSPASHARPIPGTTSRSTSRATVSRVRRSSSVSSGSMPK